MIRIGAPRRVKREWGEKLSAPAKLNHDDGKKNLNAGRVSLSLSRLSDSLIDTLEMCSCNLVCRLVCQALPRATGRKVGRSDGGEKRTYCLTYAYTTSSHGSYRLPRTTPKFNPPSTPNQRDETVGELSGFSKSPATQVARGIKLLCLLRCCHSLWLLLT